MPDRNLKIKKYRPTNRNYIFCTPLKDSLPEFNPGLYSGNISSTGTLLQFFDLREELIRKKLIKFQAKGMCMYPCARPGDILHIEYKRAEEMQIGQIAVYRKGNNLFGHRVTAKGYQENLAYILTRSDTAKGQSEGPIFNRDIAGVVCGIERKKRILPPEKVRCTWGQRIYLKILTIYSRIKARLPLRKI
jgi:hypothetical protein